MTLSRNSIRHTCEHESEHDAHLNQRTVTRRPSRRCVRFASRNAIFRTKHLNDFTTREKDNCWLTPADRTRITRENQRICRKAPFCKLGSQESIRGLEHHFFLKAMRGMRSIRLSQNAVMREQARSRRGGLLDEDKMRDSYLNASKRARAAAEARGVKDFHTIQA